MQTPSGQKNIQHLFSRAAFGISPAELLRRHNQSIPAVVEELFKESEHYTPITVVPIEQAEQRMEMAPKDMSEEQKRTFREQRKRSMMDLNLTWLEKLWSDPARLRERMTFFWHGHFACRLDNPYVMQELNNIHRQFALGKFKDLLLAVSKSTAMLQFLNNQQNKKMHPNENFAREVMELFTIGRGNYTEQDIREGARAFTGWGFEKETGEFVFREKMHDAEEKTFLGQTGHFKGEDILDMLLAKKETAHFLCTKIVRFFVNDQPDAKTVNALADSFYESGYDISSLMKSLFTAPWFYEPKNKGTLIKSPIDLIAGIHKLIPVSYDNKDGLMLYQRSLGQALFYPPNVSGWAGGRNWIDSSSLMLRLKAASRLLNEGRMDVRPKDDLLDDKKAALKTEAERNAMTEEAHKKFKPKPDWDALLASVPADYTEEQWLDLILLATPTAQLLKNLKLLKPENRKEIILEILSSPEYQLC